jgi:predicted NAD/FAD-binding protein
MSRIGIIGGGVSGMASAWFLQDDHDVTLFESAPELGGHAATVPVSISGTTTVYSELGTRFFFDSAYPYFLGLLRLLEVPVRWNDAAVSFTEIAARRTIALPPRTIRHVASLLGSPRLVRHVLSLRRLIGEQPGISAGRDFSVTFRDHLSRAGYSATFGSEFVFPFLAACWGAPLGDLPSFPVYSLLKGMPPGTKPGFYEVDGGMARYVRAFAEELARVDVRVGTGIRRIVESGNGFRIEDERGGRHDVDHVIVATSSRDAASLLGDVPAAAEMREAVGAFRHFDTDIVIHGDVSLMPPDRRDWMHTNLFVDEDGVWMSDWQGMRAGADVFRTWLPKDRETPSPLYGRKRFHHLIMTPENAVLQRRIAALQGVSNVWVTGMYAADVDNHESALLSAVVPARSLAPRSRNLSRFLEAVAPGAPHGLEVLPA